MINMHPTFTEIENAYIYSREFEDIRVATLINRIEALEYERHIQFNQVLAPMCIGCDALDHVVEECPYLMKPVQTELIQKSTFNESYINEPYAPIYNLGSGSHPNFTWSQDATLGAHNFYQPYLRLNQTLNDQSNFDPVEGVNTLEKSLDI